MGTAVKTESPAAPSRVFILVSLLVMQMLIGGHYAWSIISRELIAKHAFSATESQVTYSVYHVFFALSFLVGGRVLEKWGPRVTGLVGGGAFGLGYLLAGLFPITVPALAGCIGFLAGGGSGFCYITTIATAQKWFPEKKALITGVIVAFFAFGSVLISLTAEQLAIHGLPLSQIFQWFGGVYLVAILLAAAPLRNPPGYQADPTPFSIRELWRDRTFWAMVVPMFAGLFVGLMVVGSLKNIGLSKGIKLAGFAVILISACNGLGRMVWGWLIQRIGEDRAIIFSLLGQALILFAGLYGVRGGASFLLFAALVGLFYGCTLVVFAANVAKLYGVQRLARIYGVLFLTNGVAGVSAPLVAGIVMDRTGSYDGALAIAAGLCLLGAASYHYLRVGHQSAAPTGAQVV